MGDLLWTLTWMKSLNSSPERSQQTQEYADTATIILRLPRLAMTFQGLSQSISNLKTIAKKRKEILVINCRKKDLARPRASTKRALVTMTTTSLKLSTSKPLQRQPKAGNDPCLILSPWLTFKAL